MGNNEEFPGNTDWTKLETDHLFRLCEKYQLRFIIISDRFELDLDENEETELLKQAKGPS